MGSTASLPAAIGVSGAIRITRGSPNLVPQWVTVSGYRVHSLVSAHSAIALSGAPAEGLGRPSDPGEWPLVLVHGLSVSSRYFYPSAVRLAGSWCVYSPDLPGFGKSDKPRHILGVGALTEVLAAYLDVIGIERAIFVGQSMGCQIAAQLAVWAPERVKRLVLVGATVDPAAPTLRQQAWRLFLDTFRESFGANRIIARDYLDAGPRRTVRTFQRALEHHIEACLPQIHAPTLVVRGARDPICPQRWAEQMVRLLPNGQLAVIPHAPHAVQTSMPAAFVPAILPFISAQAPSGLHPLRSGT